MSVGRRIQVDWESDAPAGSEAAGHEDADQEGDAWRARLSLPPFAARLRAVTSNLRWESRADVDLGTSAVEIELAPVPAHEVVLVLLAPDGTPLANREVGVDRAPFTTGALVPRGARTDGRGRLVLDLPAGSHALRQIEVGTLALDEVRFDSPAPAEVRVRLRHP